MIVENGYLVTIFNIKMAEKFNDFSARPHRGVGLGPLPLHLRVHGLAHPGLVAADGGGSLPRRPLFLTRALHAEAVFIKQTGPPESAWDLTLAPTTRNTRLRANHARADAWLPPAPPGLRSPGRTLWRP